MTIRNYFGMSRQARYSLTFALPLLVLYEVLAAALSQSALAGVRNGADVMLKTVFVALGGRMGVTIFGLALLGAGAWIVWQDARRHPGPFKIAILGVMFAESFVYAAVLGTVVATLTAFLLSGSLAVPQDGSFGQLPLGSQLVVSLGAGLYEELLFRVLVVSALLKLALTLEWRRPVAVAAAVVVSALIFSAFHYVGPLGDQFTLPSFTFRAVAGLVLSGLFVARGFGITAWTHALYDIGIAVAA